MTEVINFLFADKQLLMTGTLIALIVLLVINIVTDKLKKYNVIDTHEAIGLIDESNLSIVDVREQKERKSGHIANDLHIPVAQVKNNLDKLDKNKKILVYCRSGARSASICNMLTRQEFNQVYNLKGGFLAWKKANLPITK